MDSAFTDALDSIHKTKAPDPDVRGATGDRRVALRARSTAPASRDPQSAALTRHEPASAPRRRSQLRPVPASHIDGRTLSSVSERGR
jgi:hypothetical protein